MRCCYRPSRKERRLAGIRDADSQIHRPALRLSAGGTPAHHSVRSKWNWKDVLGPATRWISRVTVWCFSSAEIIIETHLSLRTFVVLSESCASVEAFVEFMRCAKTFDFISRTDLICLINISHVSLQCRWAAGSEGNLDLQRRSQIGSRAASVSVKCRRSVRTSISGTSSRHHSWQFASCDVA